MNQENRTGQKRLAVLFAIILFVVVTSCKTEEVTCSWASSAPTPDGQTADWSGVSTTYFHEEEVVLGLCSDADKLHILFRFRDPAWARAISMGGLNIWLDADGGKSKNLGIRCKGMPSMEEIRALDGSDRGSADDRMSPDMIEMQSRQRRGDQRPFVFVDQENILNVEIPVDGSKGPAAGFAMDQSFFTYEFSIPLKESVARYYGLNCEPGRTISIGAEWGGMDRPKRPSGAMGSGSKGGGGGRGGMGGGGGMH